MKKFYIVFIGLLFGLSVGFEAFGQTPLPYTKADGTNWTEVQIDVEQTSWDLTGSGLYVGAKGGGGGGNSGNMYAQNWAISPAIQLKDVSNFLEYSDIRAGSAGSSFAIMIAQDDNGSAPAASSFVTVKQWTSLQTILTSQRINISSWSGQLVRLAFVRTNEVAASWDVNDIKVVGSDLPEVENFKVSDITNGSIGVSWTEPGNNLEYLLVGANGEIDFIPQDGVALTVGDPAGSNGGSVLMSSTGVSFIESLLNEFQTRFYKIWSYDPVTYEYALAGRAANGTTIGASTVFYEDFEGINPLGIIDQSTDPDHRDWDSDKGYIWTIESSNFWSRDVWLINGLETSFRGSRSAHIVQNGSTVPSYAGNTGELFEESILVNIPASDLDATKYKSAELSFYWKAGGKAGYDYGDIFINGTRMTTGGLSGQTKWKEEVIDITDYLGQDITLKFYWNNSSVYTGVHEPSFSVDEVMITGKSVERPVSFSATVINVSQIDLAWEKNSEGQDVLIAFSSSGTLGAPDENISYTEGDILPGGGKVIYKGSATTYSHFIEGESKANYKIWSVSTANTYSTALSASTVLPASLPFFDGFEEGFDWNTESFKNNDWYRGQAAASDGDYSAYVSNNGGFTTDWSVNSGSNAPTILELPVNLAGFTDISVSFDYLVGGQNYGAPDNYDTNNAKVFLENESAVSQEFTLTEFVDQTTWNSVSYTSNTTSLFGASSLLKFYLYDNSNFASVSFAVDNVNITGTLSPVTNSSVQNNGGLKNYVSWTNAAQNLEVVVVAGINGEVIGDVTSGTTYYVGDVLSGGGKVVYVGTGSTFTDENVMPGQQYQYKVFQKNGLTYSTGALTGSVTVPDNVGFYEDFENGTNAWTPTNFNGNTWHVGTPANNGNGSNVAFLTNDTINARYTFDNNQAAKVVFSKSFSFAAFSSGTVLEFDYLADVNAGDLAYVKLIDHNNGDAELLFTPAVSGFWSSFTSNSLNPVADVTGTNSLTIVFGVDITTANDGTYSPGFLVDNISITGSNDNTSTVSNGAGGVPSLSSLKDTEAEAVEVFSFSINDAGSGDAKPTDIHQMTITPGTTNTLSNWREVIGGAALYDATDVLITYGSIQTAGIFLDLENMISVADGDTENYKLKIWLQESLATNVDNGDLDFHLTSDNIVAYNGSSFGNPSSTSVNSTASTVSISATELRLDQQPSTSAVSGTVLSTQPVVVATDANGNIDGDYITDVSLVSIPTGVAGTTTVTPSAGSATFSDIAFNSTGIYQITASSGTLTSVTSQDITVSDGGSGTTAGPQYIGAVKLAGIENYTYERSSGGYGLFLDQEARMTTGVSYELSVYVVGGSANLRVYIDYDGDNVYDAPSEELHDFGTVSDGVYSSWVTIPTTQATGSYRLKVEFLNGTDGEIEDYTVFVTDNQWTGYTPEWDVTANWSSGQVPVDNVYIPGNPVDGNFFPVLDINRSVDQLTLESGAKMTLKPGISLTVNSALNNNGLIVMKSTIDLVSKLNVPQGNTDSGKGQVELPLIGSQWYRLGQPFASPKGDMYKAGDPTSWVYRSTTKWERITDVNNAIDPMEGIMVLYENDVTLNSTGTLNTGAMSWTISYGRGYYLFSNPYPSAIDWKLENVLEGQINTGVTVSDNVASTIYYRVYAGALVGDYMITYNGYTNTPTLPPGDLLPGGYTTENIGRISPLQSVWVKINDANPATIDLDNRARTTEKSPSLKSASSESEKNNLYIVQTNDFISDVAVISFAGGYVETIDREDSEKMFNSSRNVPEIYTRVGSKSLAINGLPALTGESYAFPVSVRNRVAGEVKLSVNLEEFTPNFDVVLEDKVAGEWINMQIVDGYTYTPEKMGDVQDRFVLHLNRVQQVPTTIDENDVLGDDHGITIIGKEESVLVKIDAALLNAGQAIIEVLDTNGRLVNSKQTTSSETEIDLPSASGMYIIKVKANGKQKTEKVLKK
jgi:hypothetical protein